MNVRTFFALCNGLRQESIHSKITFWIKWIPISGYHDTAYQHFCQKRGTLPADNWCFIRVSPASNDSRCSQGRTAEANLRKRFILRRFRTFHLRQNEVEEMNTFKA